MATGVLLVHFGEPPSPEPDVVRAYLTEIFYQNRELEDATSEAEARERAAELAERRAPGLMEEYTEIGGSPMNAQARSQGRDLATTLESRGFPASVTVAFQFMSPTIADALEGFRQDGIDHVVTLPTYPLCGPSTTVAAIERVEETIEDMDWDVSLSSVSGWHRHPGYLRLRAENVRSFLADAGIDLADSGTTLLFSAHGTPRHYLREGSRYARYVEEWSEALAALLGTDTYRLGYQNHETRDIPWTEPAIESLVDDLDADRVVVEPVSFMHEQSETLGDLDIELAEHVEAQSIAYHRVPVPHDDPAFVTVLADVIEPFLAGVTPRMYQLRPCQCASPDSAFCLNAPRG